jgi:hypothetical protein
MPGGPGVSEWFVLAAYVIASAREPTLGNLKNVALSKFGYTQRTDIHFKDLSASRRRIICDEVASHDCRLFVAISNKKNMQGYQNRRPRHDPDWFYKWMLRLLLERVTRFCRRRADLEGLDRRTVKMVLSRNGRLNYGRFKEYLTLLREQSRLGTTFNKVGDIQWDVIDLDHFSAVDHKGEAGLQFADVVASAFYQGLSLNRKGECVPEYAIQLLPRVYSVRGERLGFGVKPIPTPRRMALVPAQKKLFEAYGYPPDRW